MGRLSVGGLCAASFQAKGRVLGHRGWWWEEWGIQPGIRLHIPLKISRQMCSDDSGSTFPGRHSNLVNLVSVLFASLVGFL